MGNQQFKSLGTFKGSRILNGIFTILILSAAALFYSSCQKGEKREIEITGSTKGVASVSAAQALPGGKANFSVSIGRFATTGAVWVRMVNWTFNASAGTVAATYWQWDSTLEKGKTAFNSHTCTFDGLTATCSVYTPTGWMIPSGQYYGLTGTYTYNTSTGALVIQWSGGTSENWTISNPQTTIARALFVSSAGSGYAVTHGHGYGSNASWSTYKTIAQIPKVLYSGYNILGYNTGGGTNTLIPATAGAWGAASLSLTTATYPSNPQPVNSLHFWTQSGSPCGPPYTSRLGNVYHLSSNNNGRSMVYSHFKACLPVTGFPCYSGQRHPYAFSQIIDDAGAMLGFIGIEQQDEPGSTGFQYQLIDYTTIPW